MYSRVKMWGDPVHPMLVAFPIVFYTCAFLGYLYFSLGTNDVFWFRAAFVANVAGVIMALVASIPGFIDWAFGIPKNTEAKKVGLTHMIVNLIAVVMYAAAAIVAYPHYVIRNEVLPDSSVPALICGVAYIFMLTAAALGRKLMSTYHAGVNLTAEQERLEPKHHPTFGRWGPLGH